jgi:predicted RNA-binding Zn-ribbon protein involved in translation (DUF1610 family)
MIDESIKRGYRQFLEVYSDNEFVMPVCPHCGVNMEFKQIYTSYGLLAKGLKIVCPLCGYEE